MASTVEQRELSDSLGISSALYLGATDMLKLKAVLESTDDRDHGARALRRLAMVPMTATLARTTGIVAYMAKLQFELEQSELEPPGVCEELRSTIESVARIRSSLPGPSAGPCSNPHPSGQPQTPHLASASPTSGQRTSHWVGNNPIRTRKPQRSSFTPTPFQAPRRNYKSYLKNPFSYRHPARH